MSERPKARSEGIITERVSEDLVVYDELNQTAHSLSAAAASVWGLCDGRRPLAAIAHELALKPEMVERAVAELGECGLLDEVHVTPTPISRRDAAKRLAQVGGVAFAAPLIYSVAVPAVAAAASCHIAVGSTVSCSNCTATKGNFGTSTTGFPNCCQSGTCYQGRDNNTCYCVDASETCTRTGNLCGAGIAACCVGPCVLLLNGNHVCNQ